MRYARATLFAACLLGLLACSSSASADTTICSPGTAAGKCEAPQGLAVDFETGRLYVADRGNNRIDVFESDGTFVMAFGWGVDTGASKLETCTTASTCREGIAGSGAGQFDHPTWVAVDNDVGSTAHHDVYVGTDNFRVQRFSAAGEFVAAFGEEGKGPCKFSNSTPFYQSDPLAVGPGGDLYVADVYASAPNVFVNRVEHFDSEGSCLGEVVLFAPPTAGIRQFTVDAVGNFYATPEGSDGEIRKYNSSGTLLYEFGNGFESQGPAADPSGATFTKQRMQQVSGGGVNVFTEYDSSGTILRRFGYQSGRNLLVSGLAAFHSSSGNLFVSEGPGNEGTQRVSYLSFPPPGPVILPEPCKVKTGKLGNIKAILYAEVNPEGKETTVHFQYVDRTSFDTEGGFTSKETKTTAESESIGSDFELREATGEADLVPETDYVCRAIATNADGSTTGEEGFFTSKAPLEIGDTTVSDVGTEEATLNAEVNPLGISTTGFFEYVGEATYLKDIESLGPEHGFDHAAKAPAGEPLDFGAGEGFQLQSVSLTGLAPGTSYRFRVVATDPYFPAGFAGPTEFFRAFGAASEALPDDRAWELVSPGQKNSAEVAVPSGVAGFNESGRTRRIAAAAGSGQALTYTSWTSFGEAESAPATSQYLAKRTASGWATQNVSPRGYQAALLVPPYAGFAPDLGLGALHVTEPSLTPDCPEGRENLYLRDSASGELQCLTPEEPDSNARFGYCFVYAGASEDSSRAFFSAGVSYAGAPKASHSTETSLYEWHEGQLHAVSVLPGKSEAVTPTAHTAFGPASSGCQWGQTIVRHAISADGTRAIWTYAPEGGATSQLLDRIDGTETIQLDAKQGGSSKTGGNGVFWAASTDGSVVYFTDTERLVTGAKGEAGKPDLYRYDFGAAKPLTNLTKASEPAGVQGVVGASDDGSYVYFVAEGVLTGEEENEAGQKAAAGKPNLYLNHEGKTTFVAILDAEDRNDWETQPKVQSARVSPDGRHLAFLSIESQALAGYENTVAAKSGVFADNEHCNLNPFGDPYGSPLCPQAFLYDADSAELTCVSCNPSGSRPLGPTSLPAWSNVFEGPRFLSDEGDRYFFETYDALSAADENETRDVYEYERLGSGTCTESNPAFDPTSGGCPFLLSRGRSADQAYLVDASADGRDVFFSTRDRLSGWDTNENFDIYDAREGGGFPEPVEVPSCAGEGCLAPPPAPPGSAAPSTPAFEGPGNAKPKQSKAKKKHKTKKHKKKRHAHKRRAAR